MSTPSSPDPEAAALAAAGITITTQHNDTARTGANLRESVLTTSNVSVNRFGKLFTREVDGHIYAQPLYVGGVNVPGQGVRNVVYVATMHNSVYAFDADDPAAAAPLWRRNFGPSLPVPPDAPTTDYKHSNFQVEIGIISTPVISLSRGTLYAVALIVEGGVERHELHALDLITGAERPGSPVILAASVPGDGAGSVNGTITFDSSVQNQRAGLLLANGRIYIAFASYADIGPYHGWVLAHDADTLAPRGAFNSTPGADQGGVWQSGNGLAADDRGHLFFKTGNNGYNLGRPYQGSDQHFNTGGPQPGVDLSNSFIHLDPDLGLVDWFTPFNFRQMNDDDMDLGSSGPLVVPGTHLLIGGGKEGKVYVVDASGTASMGHHDPAQDHVVQSFQATERMDPLLKLARGFFNIHGSAVFWRGPGATLVYVWGEEDILKGYAWGDGRFLTTTDASSVQPATVGSVRASPGMPGGILSLSANGSDAGSGILWASRTLRDDATQHAVAGILHAFDATDLRRELWNSRQNAARDDVGIFAKFCPPTIANGKVYMASFSRRLNVYGLLS